MNSAVLEFTLGTNFTYSTTEYSGEESVNQSYSIQHYYTDVTVNFLHNWTIGTSFDVRFYGGDQFASNETLPLWKASISRFVLQDQCEEIKLSVFDVLDENRGISRTSNSNYIQEIHSNSLGR